MGHTSSEIIKAASGSFYIGNLPEGCVRCLEGKKSVLYATSRCGVGCFYCTIPAKTKQEDLISINEIQINRAEESGSEVPGLDSIQHEIEQCQSTGIGLTGGDPLMQPERTLQYIQKLKGEFGPDFHIHLYTSGKYLTDELMAELVNAGLDELRIHPKHINDQRVITMAARYKKEYDDMIIGFEIPAITGMHEEIKGLIEYADEYDLDFVNLNEFEFTPSNHNILNGKGFVSLDSNAGVKGSAEMIATIFNELVDSTNINLHFCSSKSKDAVQLTNRYLLRAEKVARPFEAISEEGELEFGRFECESMKQLNELYWLLIYEFEVPEELMERLDDDLVIETSWIIVDDLIRELRENQELKDLDNLDNLDNLKAAILTRHPVENGPITWMEYI